MERRNVFEEEPGDTELRLRAHRAAERAVTPRNDYAVGALVETTDGTVHTGANRELPPDDGDVNAPEVARRSDLPDDVAEAAERIAPSAATNLHAEVVALARARAKGHDEVRRVVVSTGDRDARPPCETCRPAIRDHAADDEVEVVADRSFWEGADRWSLAELEDHGETVDRLGWLGRGERATRLDAAEVTQEGEGRRLGDLIAARRGGDEAIERDERGRGGR